MSFHRFLWLLRNDPPIFAVAAVLSWLGYRRPIPTNPQRILIYKPDHLGDVLMATPALRAIRQHYPQADIKIVVGEWSEQLLQNNPDIDGVVRYNSKKFIRWNMQPVSLRKALSSLQGWKPDIVISLRDDWAILRASIFNRTPRVDRGKAQLREWLNRKKSGRVKRHETELLLDVLAPLNITPLQQPPQLRYIVEDSERVWATNLLHELGIDTQFAIIHPGVSVPLREWEVERFAIVAQEFSKRWGWRIVVVGSPEEQRKGRTLAQMLHAYNPIDLSGQLRLRQTAAIIEKAAIYVGSEGGLMHIAAAIEVPTLGLFGPGYQVFYPVGSHVRTINHSFPCSPCSQQRCIRPNDTCMMAITSDEVIAAANELIGDKVS